MFLNNSSLRRVLTIGRLAPTVAFLRSFRREACGPGWRVARRTTAPEASTTGVELGRSNNQKRVKK